MVDNVVLVVAVVVVGLAVVIVLERFMPRKLDAKSPRVALAEV